MGTGREHTPLDVLGEEAIHVLHADDDPDFTDLVAEFLEREDRRFTVDAVTGADDALDRLMACEYDCIVSDYDMPGTNGIEFLERVRETESDLPFVLFTGNGSEEIASEAISAGVTDYVPKQSGPGQYELLANRIANAVDRSRAREQAADQHRISTVVREINRALVQATTRERIHRRVCEVLTEADPYLFAWIGTVDAETDVIEPEAAAGVETGYLDAITVTADENPTGQGPAGTAVREGRVVVAQNLHEEETFDPWREEALKRGYRASAAIPLRYEDTGYGVLCVYADRRDAFDAPEQSLLSELGDTIAHAYRRVDIQHEYRNQYRELFEETSVMFVFTRDDDGEPIIDDCNRRFADRLGYGRDQLRGRPLASVYTDASTRALLDHGGYERAFDGEFVREYRELVTSDDDVVETRLYATPRRDTEGEIVGTDALYFDVTDREHLDTLESFRERMEFALDATDSILFEVNLESREETCHGPFERIFGVDPARVESSEDFYEHCVHPTDRARVRDLQSEESLADVSGAIEYEFRTDPEQGEQRWMRSEAYVSSGPDGTPRRLIGLNTDVTERRTHQRQLRETNERLRAIVAASPVAIVAVDRDGEVELWNPAAERVFGWTENEILGEPLPIVPEDRAERRDQYRDRLHAGESITGVETVRQDRDGSSIDVSFSAAPLRDADGNVTGTLGVYQDVTDYKERERDLRRQNERLERFASIVSHDLQNPLQVARGRLELARQECQSDHLSKVANALDRSETLIEDLLALAQTGEPVETVRQVGLSHVAADSWTNVATAGATLVTDTDRAIRADPGQLKQLLENLFHNAVEHGGTADDTGDGDDRAVTVTIADLDDGFFVADDGQGVAACEREQVFEAGYSTAEDGTGFGLSIVEEIAEVHGWEIRVTESDGGGARFEITGVEFV